MEKILELSESGDIPFAGTGQSGLYEEAVAKYGFALARLAGAYEADLERRRDLLQEIHVALWRSFANFAGRCSMRTWIYRVGHNVGASHILSVKRTAKPLISLAELDIMSTELDAEVCTDHKIALTRIIVLIQQLSPIERQVILLYLEGMDAASIAEITNISISNVSTKIHRIKSILTREFHKRGAP